MAPLVAAAIKGGVTVGSALLPRLIGGGGPSDAQNATAIVNTAEPFMQANLRAWQSGQISREVALAEYDRLWAEVVSRCSDPALGKSGQACISDRSPGGRWPWAEYYRDPIAGSGLVASSGTSSQPAGSSGTAMQASGGFSLLGVAGVAVGTLVVSALLFGGDEGGRGGAR